MRLGLANPKIRKPHISKPQLANVKMRKPHITKPQN